MSRTADPCIQPGKGGERDQGALCSGFRDRAGGAHWTPAHIPLVGPQFVSPGRKEMSNRTAELSGRLARCQEGSWEDRIL